MVLSSRIENPNELRNTPSVSRRRCEGHDGPIRVYIGNGVDK